tara:strand:- start:842 stop:1126 length:285 start_codon:yes stop_codon:yes gene_type:complete
MNKILIIILAVTLNSCASENIDKQLESCADSMFVLTNELMAERLPGEAQPEGVIREFLIQSYDDKKGYDYYKALIMICKNQKDRDSEKFDEDYK